MITYAVTTHNEGQKYIRHLLLQLVDCKQPEDEIIVIDDYSEDASTLEALKLFDSLITVHKHHLNNNFAEHKNFISTVAKGEYIFQIDADELLGSALAEQLPELLADNPTIDIFYLPRVNRVTGLTPEDIAKWNWEVDSQNRVMWPDYQGRIYKNNGTVHWTRPVHEVLVGKDVILIVMLPKEEQWALIHNKDVTRQRKQNEFYETIN